MRVGWIVLLFFPLRGHALDTLQVSRDSVVAYAGKFLGLSYRYGSRDTSRGVDCSGFTRLVYQNFGLQLGYSSVSQANQGEKIEGNTAIPGDLVFFRRSARSRIFHVALVSRVVNDSIFVLHSTTHGGVREDNLVTAPFWRTKVKSFRNVLPGSRTYQPMLLTSSTAIPSAPAEDRDDLQPLSFRQPFVSFPPLPALTIRPVSQALNPN